MGNYIQISQVDDLFFELAHDRTPGCTVLNSATVKSIMSLIQLTSMQFVGHLPRVMCVVTILDLQRGCAVDCSVPSIALQISSMSAGTTFFDVRNLASTGMRQRRFSSMFSCNVFI